MTRKKEKKRHQVTSTAITCIQLKISFMVWFFISLAFRLAENIPKQMLFVRALARSSKAHLSNGTLYFEKELKISWPTTDIIHEKDTNCPSMV